MVKFTASFALLAALCCCSVEGASIGDLYAAIYKVGSQLRAEAIQRLRQADLDPQQAPCTGTAARQGLRDLSVELYNEQQRLRAELPSLFPILPTLSQDQLEQRARERLEPHVNSAIDNFLAQVNNCTAA